MATFPTLTTLPNISGGAFGTTNLIDVLKSETEGSYEVTRARSTRTRKVFRVSYTNLSLTDFNSLQTFYNTTVRGESIIFTWTNPEIAASHEVRFNSVLSWTPMENGKKNLSFELKEV